MATIMESLYKELALERRILDQLLNCSDIIIGEHIEIHFAFIAETRDAIHGLERAIVNAGYTIPERVISCDEILPESIKTYLDALKSYSIEPDTPETNT
jgi:hypothetical protein